MPKFGVTVTYSERRYKEVEADNEDDAIELVAAMEDSELEPMGDDDYDYEAEELDG